MGVFVPSKMGSSRLHLIKQQRMGWVEDLRSEFPGLKASPNWVLCDAAGGTQAHQWVVSAVGASLASSTANLGGTYPSALDNKRNGKSKRYSGCISQFFSRRGHFWSQHDNADPPCLQSNRTDIGPG